MYGDHLLKNAQKSDKGYFWQSSVLSDVYVGLGHGSMGIAWALFRLAAVTGKEAYRETAENALQYVRSHYSSEWGIGLIAKLVPPWLIGVTEQVESGLA